MAKFNIEEHKKWYESQRPTYELLSNTVKNTLESLIKNAKIDYLSITFRAKEIDSFVEKVSRKNYQNPVQEITDLAGIRVITFIESDALKVNELIKNSFNVDDTKSLDKSNELGIDKFGYRSFHFVCGLGEARCALPEFGLFKDLVCEIQVRTVLQHAWAEIEHDRNYKFAGNLPNPIKRRLHLLAGLLEVADGEFNKLSKDIDEYSELSLQKTKAGNLDIEINSITLEQYLQESESVKFVCDMAEKANFARTPDRLERSFLEILSVCDYLNITTIKSIDDILKSGKSWTLDYLTKLREINITGSWYGEESFFVLLIIIAENIKKLGRKYFQDKDWVPEIVDYIFVAVKVIKSKTEH